MKKIIISLLLFQIYQVISAQEKIETSSTVAKKNLTNVNSISKVFKELDSVLTIDNGRFWGKSLKGPLMIVDNQSRVFYANQNNSSHSFDSINGVFTSVLPDSIPIANTAFYWEDKRWSMVMLPLPTDINSRNNLLIHELFHGIQPKIGFGKLQEVNNDHLDTFEGRLLLKLELEALKKALVTGNDSLMKLHVENALTFRKHRQNSLEIKNNENNLELNEGLAEYTGLSLSGRTNSQTEKHLINQIDNFYNNKTFVRSFAYYTIPVYGYLLLRSNGNWNQGITIDTNLTDFMETAFDLHVLINEPYKELALTQEYNYKQLLNSEIEREEQKRVLLKKFNEKYNSETILKLQFKEMRISYDPTTIVPLEGLGKIYYSVTITDSWGTLKVESDALIDENWAWVAISNPIEIKENVAKGEDWSLKLNKDWRIENEGTTYKLIRK